MDLVRYQNVSKDYGAVTVLTDVTFLVTSGKKLGLIGPNGAGKTSILRLLTGDEALTSGSIAKAHGLRVGYVPQHVEFDEGQTVFESVVAEHSRVEERLREQEHRLAEATGDGVAEAADAYERMRDEYEQAGGHQFRRRAVSMLDALGLRGRGGQPVGELSGGEKNVLSLTKAARDLCRRLQAARDPRPGTAPSGGACTCPSGAPSLGRVSRV